MVKMLKMLPQWPVLLLILTQVLLVASRRQPEHGKFGVVTSQPDKLTPHISNELHDDTNDDGNSDGDDDEGDDNDDYYSDNEQSDSIDTDYAAPEYRHWIGLSSQHQQHQQQKQPATHATTSSTPSTSVASATSPTASLAWHHAKRVPRHPQHLWNDNRVNSDDAAFDEEEGYQSDQAVGVLTAQKLHEVGTPDMVQQSRRLYQERNRNQTLLRQMATLHRQRIETEARCKWPQPRVIHVNNETSKQYAPRATILHRCEDTTGCCPDSMVCAVKTKTTVELPFWVLATGSMRAQAQMVALTNHTECECVNLAGLRRKRSSQCQCPKHFTNFSNPTWQWQQRALITPAGCRCDCHLSDATCQRMKNGEEGFAMSERRCIMHNECSPPICNYGVYSLHSGRCPRPPQQHQQQPRQLGFG